MQSFAVSMSYDSEHRLTCQIESVLCCRTSSRRSYVQLSSVITADNRALCSLNKLKYCNVIG